MMMEALEAGGMDAAYAVERDQILNSRFGEPDAPEPYVPNDRYFELLPECYRDRDFPQGYEGRLIKCLYGAAELLPPGDYRMIFMRRDRQSVYRSILRFFDRPTLQVERVEFNRLMDEAVARLRDRRSIRLTEVWYDNVVDDPLSQFQRIEAAGWPINPHAAAKIPTDRKRRAA